MLADGTILLAGDTNNGANQDFAVVGLDADGALVTQFNPVTTLDGNPTFVEDGAPVVLDADVQVFDAELSAIDDFGGATLTIERLGGANADDVFSPTGTIGAMTEGGNLELGVATIGTVDTNSGGTLQISFWFGVTNDQVNEFMRQIAYSNSSDTPPASVQLDWTFNDGNSGSQGTGGALTATGSTIVNITPVNDDPVVTLNSGGLTYVENSTLVISPGATVSDADSADFDGGSLTVVYASGNTAADQLGVQNVGTGVGEIGVSGSDVTYNFGSGAVVIGTIGGVGSNGVNGNDLIITLNSSATAAAVEELVQNITYSNTSQNPTEVTRPIEFTLTDGDGGTSATISRNITPQQVNDAPAVNYSAGNQNVDEDASLVFSLANGNRFYISDDDIQADPAAVTLTVTNGTLTLAQTTGLSNLSGDGTSTVSFTGNLANVNAALNGLTYSPDADYNGAETLNIQVTDQGDVYDQGTGGAQSDNFDINITVDPVNDAPVFDLASGIVSTSINTGDDRVFSTLVQPDGKILVAGNTFNGADTDFSISRYNPDGTLDSSFGSGGIVTTAIGPGLDEGITLAVQADGKIVLSGYTDNGADLDAAVVRYNTDGSLDTGFGSGGIVTTDLGNNEIFYGLAIQTDGKIVQVGRTEVGGISDLTVVRYNADGSLDTGFGSGGIATIDTGTNDENAAGVALQADGRIVVSGFRDNGTDNDFLVARLNTDGTLDATFGTGGIATADVAGGDDDGIRTAIQSDGKIVVVGYASNGTDSDITLVRFNTDGTLDAGFGTGGVVATDFGAGDDLAYSLALQGDGKIVVTGFAANGVDNDVVLMRFNSDGSLDTSFATGGIYATQAGLADAQSTTLAIQPDGRIVAAGHYDPGTGYDQFLMRFNSDGSLDTSFGTATYVEGGTPIVLDSDIKVRDTELDALNGGMGDYTGASLLIERNGGGNTEDVYGFNDGNGITSVPNAGGYSLYNSGGKLIAALDTVTFPGAAFITFTDMEGDKPTSAEVDTILQQITYSNSSDAPPASVQLDWTFRDGNSGSQGSGGDLQATASTTVNIVPTNDAPVLDNSGTPTLTQIDEGDIHNSGDLISDILASAGDPITDPDIGAVEGIAVTLVDDTNGTWEYSTDGGIGWTPVGAVSDSAALVLSDGPLDVSVSCHRPTSTALPHLTSAPGTAQTGTPAVRPASMSRPTVTLPPTAWPPRRRRSRYSHCK